MIKKKVSESNLLSGTFFFGLVSKLIYFSNYEFGILNILFENCYLINSVKWKYIGVWVVQKEEHIS